MKIQILILIILILLLPFIYSVKVDKEKFCYKKCIKEVEIKDKKLFRLCFEVCKKGF